MGLDPRNPSPLWSATARPTEILLKNRVDLCFVLAGQEDFLSNIVHLFNVGSTLGQRRRRWPSIKTALDQCLV